MKRVVPIAQGEHYHILNRGNNKQILFKDDKDRVRFLFLLLYFQSPLTFPKISPITSNYVKHPVFDVSDENIKSIIRDRFIDVLNFALMPNHFHLTVYEKKEGGIARYMQRVLNSYTKYFNTRHEQSGHLFQGPYRAVHIKDEGQLFYLSAYIHRNPRELPQWKNKEHHYPWSSYQDYIGTNRWGKLLAHELITEQFLNNEYREFVEESGAKEIELEQFDKI